MKPLCVGDPRVPPLDQTGRGVPAGRAATTEPDVTAARLPPRSHREKA